MAVRLPTPIVHIPGWNAQDITGNTSPSWTGTAAYTRDHRGRVAVDMDGSSAITIGRLGLSEGDPQTIALWFRTSELGAGALVSTFVPGVAGALTLVLYSGGYLRAIFGTTYQGYSNAVSLADGAWHLGVITYDGAAIRYYNDGEFVIADTTITGTWTATTDTLIGARSDGAGGISSGFDGDIADVRIYTEVLDAEQVQALYRQSPPVMPTIPQPLSRVPDVTDPTLEGAWLNGLAHGGRDASDNGRDLTPAGNVAFQADRAAGFDGATGRLIGSIPTWFSLDADLTCVMSCRFSGSDTTNVLLIAIADVNNRFGVYARAGVSAIEAVAHNGDTYSRVRSGTVTKGTVWCRVCVTWDATASQIALWINGIRNDDNEATAGLVGTAMFGIGAYGDNDGDYHITGDIRDVRIYSRALSATEIAADYAAAVPDTSLALLMDPARDDLSRYRRTITRTNVTVNNQWLVFASGGLAWSSMTVTSYAYWWDPDDGTGPHHWATNGTTVYQDGVATEDSLPVTVTATGFSSATGRMMGLRVWDAAKPTSYLAHIPIAERIYM